MIRLQLLSAFPLLLLQTSSASPIANVTTVNYQHEPKTRGTVGLLLSCTVTLFLCVWTALHLNIEPLEFSRSKLTCTSRLIGKVIWGFTALVIPEIVLSIALHQFLVAWRYRRVLNAGSVSRDETNGRGEAGHASGAAEAVEEVGLKKAFYAIMGGFAVESTKSFAVTLDVDMLENDAAVEKIRHYPIAQIDDKSKANYVAKILTCVQACWIVLQCLGRKLNDLPITLLELNTALHVVNALVMYGLWWEKPVDVSQPSIISRSEEAWGKESEETTTFLPLNALLSNQRTVKERIAPLLRNPHFADERPRLLAAQIDECDLSDEILDRLERLTVSLELFKFVAHVVGITAHPLAAKTELFFDDRQSPATLGGEFGQAFGQAFRETFGGVFGATFGEEFGGALGGAFAYVLGAGEGQVAQAAFSETFHDTFHPTTSAATILPEDPINIPRIGFHNQAQNSRALHEAVRNTAHFALVVANFGADSSVYPCTHEAVQGLPQAIPLACHKGGITSQDGVIEHFEYASYTDLLPIAYRTLRIAFRDGAHNFRALHGDAQKVIHEAVRTGAVEELLQTILPACPKGGITSLDGAIKYLERVVSYADILPIAYRRIEKERTVAGTINGESPKPETRQRIYGEVFLHVRKRALDITNNASRGDGERAAAFKAAFHLDPYTVIRPAGAEAGCERLGGYKQLMSTLSDGGRHIWNQLVWAPGVFGKGQKLKWFDHRWCHRHRIILLAFAICNGAFYGGMHSLRWNDHFPSETERFLWKVSTCVGAAGSVPLAALAVIVWAELPGLLPLLYWVLFVISGLVFLAARVFLIVESFISVRDLPMRAYETVQWAESIPHI